ncbi:MAG: MBL fold metallo-hydrolase [Lachnospiraceae bacterium]|nr:MBL fold metallo-hydrolase [Lachnospiraceae bacterium]
MKKNRRLLAFLITVVLFFTACTPAVEESPLSEEGNLTKSNESESLAGTKDSKLEVHFIDVGQGDATLITCDGESMLIDAGDNSKGTAVQQYLRMQDISELEYVIGTHPDADHVGGLDVVITKFDCHTIFLTGEERDTDTYRDVLDAMAYKGYEMTVPSAGEEYALGSAEFTIEGPIILGEDSNDNSIVIHLEHGDNSFLFAGDAGEEEEKDILSTGRDIEADVYKIGHHGSKTSTSEEFLQAVNPKYAMISVGEDNKYGHPSAEVLNRLRMQGIEVFRTDEQGSIVAVSDGEAITFNSSPSESWTSGEAKGSVLQAGDVDKEDLDYTESGKNDEIADNIVHITASGTKYHVDGCKHLKDSDIEISLEEAKQKGYEPCKVCEPDSNLAIK